LRIPLPHPLLLRPALVRVPYSLHIYILFKRREPGLNNLLHDRSIMLEKAPPEIEAQVSLVHAPLDFLWQNALHRTAHYCPGPSISKLLLGRDCDAELNEALIKKGITSLNREGTRSCVR
jgi:hypothetical protein